MSAIVTHIPSLRRYTKMVFVDISVHKRLWNTTNPKISLCYAASL